MPVTARKKSLNDDSPAGNLQVYILGSLMAGSSGTLLETKGSIMSYTSIFLADQSDRNPDCQNGDRHMRRKDVETTSYYITSVSQKAKNKSFCGHIRGHVRRLRTPFCFLITEYEVGSVSSHETDDNEHDRCNIT